MSQLGTLWPNTVQTTQIHGIEVKRGQGLGPLAERPVALLLDGGGRQAALLALTEVAARQLVRDLVQVLGPEQQQQAAEVKPAEVKPAEVKPAEVKPIRTGPGPERHSRS